jgi:hypothetical protein
VRRISVEHGVYLLLYSFEVGSRDYEKHCTFSVTVVDFDDIIRDGRCLVTPAMRLRA